MARLLRVAVHPHVPTLDEPLHPGPRQAAHASQIGVEPLASLGLGYDVLPDIHRRLSAGARITQP
jgi:hypothetical protein